jgi:hypothetical protein
MRPLPSLFGFNCDLHSIGVPHLVYHSNTGAWFFFNDFVLLMILTFECNEFSLLEQ